MTDLGSATRSESATPPSKCPACSYSLLMWKSSHPELAQPIVFCPNCGIEVKPDGTRGAGSYWEWAEHYEHDILRFPDVQLGAQRDSAERTP